MLIDILLLNFIHFPISRYCNFDDVTICYQTFDLEEDQFHSNIVGNKLAVNSNIYSFHGRMSYGNKSASFGQWKASAGGNKYGHIVVLSILISDCWNEN